MCKYCCLPCMQSSLWSCRQYTHLSCYIEEFNIQGIWIHKVYGCHSLWSLNSLDTREVESSDIEGLKKWAFSLARSFSHACPLILTFTLQLSMGVPWWIPCGMFMTSSQPKSWAQECWEFELLLCFYGFQSNWITSILPSSDSQELPFVWCYSLGSLTFNMALKSCSNEGKCFHVFTTNVSKERPHYNNIGGQWAILVINKRTRISYEVSQPIKARKFSQSSGHTLKTPIFLIGYLY